MWVHATGVDTQIQIWVYTTLKAGPMPIRAENMILAKILARIKTRTMILGQARARSSFEWAGKGWTGRALSSFQQ